MIDPISKVSGCASRHLSTRAVLMSQHLQKLQVLWPIAEEFKEFMSRKDTHDETEKKMSHGLLPILFLQDAAVKFNTHFVAQWLSNKLLPLALAGMPSVSKSFTRWLLNLPVDCINVASKLH